MRSRRLTAPLLLALLALGCTTALRSGLPEHEADRIVLALDDHAIAASKEAEPSIGTFHVNVARAEETNALRVLQELGALTPAAPSTVALLGELALVQTPSDAAQRWALATAGEVARSIERLPGVLEARVHIAPALVSATLGAEPRAARAAVLVRRAHGTRELPTETMRSLITGATEGLAASDVKVVQTEAPASTVQTRLIHLGPWSVARASASSLRRALAAGLTLHALLAVAIIAIVARARRARRATSQAG